MAQSSEATVLVAAVLPVPHATLDETHKVLTLNSLSRTGGTGTYYFLKSVEHCWVQFLYCTGTIIIIPVLQYTKG